MDDEWVETVEPVAPTKRQKYMFWLILAFLSAFFAEVISGSFPYPFINPLGLVMVVPLYGLHILVLAHVVFKIGRPRFSTLFLAGCIFGMYEAYVTKVLWNPPWESLAEPTTRLGGVAFVELGVISFFWHPFMAFIVPLAVALALTSTPGMMEAMPATLSRWFHHKERTVLVALAIWGGLVIGSQVAPHTAVLANVSALVVMFLLVTYFMKETGGRYTMEQLLPDQREAMRLFGVLLVYFAVTGALMRPEALPGAVPQAIVLAIYAILILLLWRSIRVGRAQGPVDPWRPSLDMGSSLNLFIVYTVSAVGTSVLALLFIGPIFLILSWIAWAVIAVLCMIFSVRDALRPVGHLEVQEPEVPAELQPSD
jgi:hypothetical protein